MVVECNNCGDVMSNRYAEVMLPKKVSTAPECPNCVDVNKGEWSEVWDEY